METNPIRVCELLVGLPDVQVLGVDDSPGEPLRVHVETRGPRPRCPQCGARALVKDRDPVELVDLAVFGRPARLVWRAERHTARRIELTERQRRHPLIFAWPVILRVLREGIYR